MNLEVRLTWQAAHLLLPSEIESEAMNTIKRIPAALAAAYRAAVAAIGRAWRALGGGGPGVESKAQQGGGGPGVEK